MERNVSGPDDQPDGAPPPPPAGRREIMRVISRSARGKSLRVTAGWSARAASKLTTVVHGTDFTFMVGVALHATFALIARARPDYQCRGAILFVV